MLKKIKNHLLNNIILYIEIILVVCLFAVGCFLICSYKNEEIKKLEQENYQLKSHKTDSVTNNFYVIKEKDLSILESEEIHLDKNIKKHIKSESIKNNIEVDLVLAIIDTESNFDINAVSPTEDYGLMGINKINLDPNKALNPYENISCGTKILGDLNAKYNDNNFVLMSYNMGEYGALNARKCGISTTDYVSKVNAKYNEFKEAKMETEIRFEYLGKDKTTLVFKNYTLVNGEKQYTGYTFRKTYEKNSVNDMINLYTYAGRKIKKFIVDFWEMVKDSEDENKVETVGLEAGNKFIELFVN